MKISPEVQLAKGCSIYIGTLSKRSRKSSKHKEGCPGLGPAQDLGGSEGRKRAPEFYIRNLCMAQKKSTSSKFARPTASRVLENQSAPLHPHSPTSSSCFSLARPLVHLLIETAEVQQ